MLCHKTNLNDNNLTRLKILDLVVNISSQFGSIQKEEK